MSSHGIYFVEEDGSEGERHVDFVLTFSSLEDETESERLKRKVFLDSLREEGLQLQTKHGDTWNYVLIHAPHDVLM